MDAKKLGLGGLVALAALALVAVIAANPFSTQASTMDTPQTRPEEERLSADVVSPSQIAQPDIIGQLQAADADDEDGKPYIGVMVRATDSGAIEVVFVMDGSPADGVLEVGDVITAIDGTTVAGVGDLSTAVETAGVDGTLSLTITRDGASQTVSLTVGEWDGDVKVWGRKSQSWHIFPRGNRGGWGGKMGIKRGDKDGGKPVSATMVYQDADGNNTTHRMVVGTASNIDATAGTFTLTPKDGSAAINYTATDDTKVMLVNNGDIGGLNATDDVLVYDVDGEVKLVQQGDFGGKRMMGKGGMRGFGKGMMGRGGRHHGFGGKVMMIRSDERGIRGWISSASGILPWADDDSDRS